VANAQEENVVTIQIKLINSMLDVSTSQYQRAIEYINEYNEANRLLTEVTVFLTTNMRDVLNMTAVQGFLGEIQSHLTNNVQKLIIDYSPDNVRTFIFSYFTTFNTNLALNNGAFTELTELTLLYFTKILSPNATICMAKHADDILQIYSNAASGFIKVMEDDVSTTVTQLDTYKAQIKTMVTGLAQDLQNVAANRATAPQKFAEFLTSTGSTIINQIDTWIVQFGGLMKQTQTNIKNGFKQFDGGRANQTLALVRKTTECLSAII